MDTPRSAYLHFEPPSDVVFQDSSGGFICQGTKQPLDINLICDVDGQVRTISLASLENPSDTADMRSGTTIQFKVGYLKNPPSLKPSGFFKISTFLIDPITQAHNYINKNEDSV